MTTVILLMLSIISLCQTINVYLLRKRLNMLNLILNYVDKREIRHYENFKERLREVTHDSKRNR